MNGVDHVEPHTAIPDARRRLSSIAGQRATPFDAAAPTSTRSASAVERRPPGARDRRRRAARRRGLREPPARRALGARLSQAAERARADAARVVRGAARRCSRRCVGARYPAGELRLCVEDAAAEPPARQHLRLQHRRRARREHDAVRPRAAGRRRRRRRRRSTRLPIPSRRRRRASSARSSSTSTHASARRSSTHSSTCRSTARSPGAGSTRRRSTRRSRSGRATRRSRRSSAPDGRRVEFQVLGEEQVVSHVMSRYETPWALNVRRLHVPWWAPALPPCGYAAFDLQIGSLSAAPCRPACRVGRTYKRPRLQRRLRVVVRTPSRDCRRTLRREREAAALGERRWDV